MKISCFTRSSHKHNDLLSLGINFKTLDKILKESDIINISIPLTDETRNLISKDKIDLTKSTATFINTSRIDIVDTKALIEKADEYNTFYVGFDIGLNGYEELLDKINNELEEDKLAYIKPFDENAQTSLGNVNLIRVGVLQSGKEVIIRCHPKGVKNGYFYAESLAS